MASAQAICHALAVSERLWPCPAFCFRITVAASTAGPLFTALFGLRSMVSPLIDYHNRNSWSGKPVTTFRFEQVSSRGDQLWAADMLRQKCRRADRHRSRPDPRVIHGSVEHDLERALL